MSALGSIGSSSTNFKQLDYGNNHSPTNRNFNASVFSPAPELKPSLNNLFQQGINQINFNGVRGNQGSQTGQGLEGIQLAKGPVTNTRPGVGVSTTTSYTQPFINNNVNNLIREIQTVRPTFQYNRITQIGTPYNQNDVDNLTGIRDKLRADLLTQLPQSDANSIVVRNMTLSSLNDRVDQTQFRTYQANGGKAGFQEWATEKPTSPHESKLDADKKQGLSIPKDLPTNIHTGAQGKHIEGHNNFDPNRSPLTANPQELLDGVHSGKYLVIRITNGQPPKPIVDFGKPIGEYVNDGKNYGATNFGQISSKKNGLGAHIIPANPNQY